jgi:hypothetical protein
MAGFLVPRADADIAQAVADSGELENAGRFFAILPLNS